METKLPNTSLLHFRPAKAIGLDDAYADRDSESLGEHFMRHLDRMTVEKLHSKSAIAAELAHRDTLIDRATSEIARLQANEHSLVLDESDQECLRIGRAIQRAAGELPENYRVTIDIDKGASRAKMLNPSLESLHIDDPVAGLGHCLTELIDAAIAEAACASKGEE